MGEAAKATLVQISKRLIFGNFGVASGSDFTILARLAEPSAISPLSLGGKSHFSACEIFHNLINSS
jgi:hypothetical protein